MMPPSHQFENHSVFKLFGERQDNTFPEQLTTLTILQVTTFFNLLTAGALESYRTFRRPPGGSLHSFSSCQVAKLFRRGYKSHLTGWAFNVTMVHLVHSGTISQLRARPEDAAVPAWSQDCVRCTEGATWDTIPVPVPMPPLRLHGSPGRTRCATVMHLQPESSQVGPDEDLAQTAWYCPSAATGLKGAT
jgi:hypothetical protein